MSSDHDQALSRAFDVQAPRFERAPVQSDPAALERLVMFAGFAPGGRILDAGCGPGLVSAALLAAGYCVVGVDLSREMIDRARRRCEPWSDRAEFHHLSLFHAALDDLAPFDGALSRYVVHHTIDPLAFAARQVRLLRPGGTLVISDHLTDPHPETARHHEAIERARDQTHTTNLTGGQLVDLLYRAGLEQVAFLEESFVLDFDEWFDRGTPQDSKDHVRAQLLNGPAIRSFRPSVQPDGSIRIDCIRGLLKGSKQTEDNF
jgi:SAM-dependent methyltransferase